MRQYVEELLRLGLTRRNNFSSWASASLLVPKTKYADAFLCTVDLKVVHSLAEKITWPIPHLDAIVSKLKGPSSSS